MSSGACIQVATRQALWLHDQSMAVTGTCEQKTSDHMLGCKGRFSCESEDTALSEFASDHELRVCAVITAVGVPKAATAECLCAMRL